MTVYAGYLQAGTYTALQDRRLKSAAMNGISTNGGSFNGVISVGAASNLKVSNVSGFGISVEPGSAMVDQYHVVSDAAAALTVAASTATARRDLVIARVYDQESGDATSEAKIEIVKGTTTADPTIPARSLVLAQIDISASAASITAGMIVDRRTYTSAAGGVVMTSNPTPLLAKLGTGTPVWDSVRAQLGIRVSSSALNYLVAPETMDGSRHNIPRFITATFAVTTNEFGQFLVSYAGARLTWIDGCACTQVIFEVDDEPLWFRAYYGGTQMGQGPNMIFQAMNKLGGWHANKAVVVQCLVVGQEN
jgi:hypothetical protein